MRLVQDGDRETITLVGEYRKSEATDTGALVQHVGGGDTCDITGEARKATVTYVRATRARPGADAHTVSYHVCHVQSACEPCLCTASGYKLGV